MNPIGRRTLLGAVLAGAAISRARAQESPTQPYVPKQSDRPELISGDEPGFTPIFDGKSLTGWEGDP